MLPLLSVKPAVTFPAAEHHRSLAITKLYCLMIETSHVCENKLPRVVTLQWKGWESKVTAGLTEPATS